MYILVEKAKRTLSLLDGDTLLLHCPVALGSAPIGHKRRQGDGRTPEGCYTICLVKEKGKFGRSLGLNYPNGADAEAALMRGDIDPATHQAIVTAIDEGRRPPWGSPLGGEIYIHEGGSAVDWTAGCIALDSAHMDALWPCHTQIKRVLILP